MKEAKCRNLTVELEDGTKQTIPFPLDELGEFDSDASESVAAKHGLPEHLVVAALLKSQLDQIDELKREYAEMRGEQTK